MSFFNHSWMECNITHVLTRFKMDNGGAMDKPELVHFYPEQVRKQIVEILKTGNVKKEYLINEHMLCYLEVCSMSQPLKNACEELLVETLNNYNCIDALEIGEKYALMHLKDLALNVIGDNLSTVKDSDAFVLIQFKHMEELCKREKVAKHEDIYLALEKWLHWNSSKRTDAYQSLLQIITRNRTKELNSKNETNESFRIYHALLLTSGFHKHWVTSIVFGSKGEFVCNRKLFQSTDIKDGFSAVCVQKDHTEAPYIYIVSGKHVIRYDPILNRHESCHSLTHSRSGASLVSIGDHIYVLGGSHGNQKVLEVEELDAKHQKNVLHIKKSWKVVVNLPEEVNLNNAACISYEDKIYIIGDILINNDVKTGILSFQPEEKQFKVVCQLPQRFDNCKAVVHGCCIFIAASNNERALFKFDILSGTFVLCSNHPVIFFNFEMFASENFIYVVNYRENQPESEKPNLLKYDPETNFWTSGICDSCPCNMPIYGCCNVKIPSDTNVMPFDGV